MDMTTEKVFSCDPEQDRENENSQHSHARKLNGDVKIMHTKVYLKVDDSVPIL